MTKELKLWNPNFTFRSLKLFHSIDFFVQQVDIIYSNTLSRSRRVWGWGKNGQNSEKIKILSKHISIKIFIPLSNKTQWQHINWNDFNFLLATIERWEKYHAEYFPTPPYYSWSFKKNWDLGNGLADISGIIMDSWLKHHAGKAGVLGLVSAKANYFIFVPRTRTALLTPELSYNVPKQSHWSQDGTGKVVNGWKWSYLH